MQFCVPLLSFSALEFVLLALVPLTHRILTTANEKVLYLLPFFSPLLLTNFIFFLLSPFSSFGDPLGGSGSYSKAPGNHNGTEKGKTKRDGSVNWGNIRGKERKGTIATDQ